jgi:DNA-binding transcriptional LysR family regulator
MGLYEEFAHESVSVLLVRGSLNVRPIRYLLGKWRWHHSATGIIDMDKRVGSELRLEELRVLSILLRECSITRTADLLETTQPAISKVLKHLREQFSDPLFVRNGHVMRPTIRALDIAGKLHQLLQAADELRAVTNSFNPARSDREFTLLLTDVGMIRFLPPLIASIAAIAPRVSLRALPLDERHFEQKLEANDVDLAMGWLPKAAPHLRRQRLYFDDYVCVTRRQHPRLRALQCYAGFVAERHILVTASEAGHAAHRNAELAIGMKVPSQNILLRVPSFVAGAIVAAETDGIATLPANLAKRIADPLGLVTFEPPIMLPRIEIFQYWHERHHRDVAHRWIRLRTFELFRQKYA